jgi:hypothetical protein
MFFLVSTSNDTTLDEHVTAVRIALLEEKLSSIAQHITLFYYCAARKGAV